MSLDELIRSVLQQTRSIAVVGYSMKPQRASNYVSAFLAGHGYEILPVNPGHAGAQALGNTVVSHLRDLNRPVDMIDVFRRPDALPQVLEAVQEMQHVPKVLWMQLGISHAGVAREAEEMGITVIQNRCPKIEIPRLFGASSPLGG